jgi:hypothetical protein
LRWLQSIHLSFESLRGSGQPLLYSDSKLRQIAPQINLHEKQAEKHFLLAFPAQMTGNCYAISPSSDLICINFQTRQSSICSAYLKALQTHFEKKRK